MYTDETLKCVSCGEPFTFGISQQRFFAEKGFTNKPSRCPDCRDERKAQRGGAGTQGRAEREMFAATCAACNKATEVPFKPRDDRPVYCRECFATRQVAR